MHVLSPSAPRRAVVLWFGGVAALVVAMIAIGGITRLTNSGLSMVTWEPLLGAVPPLTHAAWLETFARYQQFPQYHATFPDLDLGGFQRLFFWEYLHRLVGRTVAFAVLLPGLYLALKGQLDRGLRQKLLAMLGLVLAQGALGWFMVKSGLVDEPRVSHYRLAAHLSMAFLMLAYVLWALFDELASREEGPELPALRRGLAAFLALVCVQIVYGALTAGLRAGYGYNTFPTMYGAWFPDAAFALRPLWKNVLENPAGVQLVHRSLAWLVAASALVLAVLAARRPLSARQRRCVRAILAIVALQFTLGVATLVLFIPVWLASLHQLGGCLLFAATLRANHALRVRAPARQESRLLLRVVRT